VSNSAGRSVMLALGSDPDVRIEEDFSGKPRKKVANPSYGVRRTVKRFL